MTKRVMWLAGVGVTAIMSAVTGCSEKPREIKIAKEVRPDGADNTIELPKGPAPTQSDPAAAKIVSDAIAAHTDGNPALLDKLKTFRLTRTGTLSDSGTQLNWEFRAAWPDRLRLDDINSRTVICRAGASVWISKSISQGSQKELLQGQAALGAQADGTYEWFGVIVPLTDANLVAAPYQDAEIGGRQAVGVRVSSPNFPNAVVHFDKETKLLARFAYEGNEASFPMVKEVRVSDYRPVQGVKLPHKQTIKWVGRPAVEWTVNKIEFPADLPAKVFEEP